MIKEICEVVSCVSRLKLREIRGEEVTTVVVPWRDQALDRRRGEAFPGTLRPSQSGS